MTSVFQLYGRPLAASSPLPPLRITGDLEGYPVGEPYEGRLQIIDSVGKCVVEIVESSLPPGSYAFVDNFTKEIVLRWPAYAPPDAMAPGVPNGDFEQGNDGSWRLGAGWSIEAGDAETGTYSAVYQNQRGMQSIESNRVPYTPGQSITAACRFEQGASSKGNLMGRILLIWCDENGNMIPGGEGVSFNGGNLISSGSNGAWHTSSVTAQSNNPLVRTVAVGFSADRLKQNKLARVDNFTWDHTYSAGTDSDLGFTVTFKVTDSANRVAYWSGSIVVYAPKYPRFLLSGNSGSMSKSNEDGTAFSSAYIPSNWFSADYPVYKIGPRIIGCASGNIRYSDDEAMTFTLIDVPGVSPQYGDSNGSLVIIPRAGGGCLRSTDGVTWTAHGGTASFTGGIVIGDGIVCALGNPNVPLYSVDGGVTWVSGSQVGTSVESFTAGGPRAGAYYEGSCYFGGEIWGGPYGVSSYIPAIAITTGGNVFTFERVHTRAGLTSVSRVVISDISVCVLNSGQVYYKPPGGVWTYSGFTLSGAVDVLNYNNNRFVLGGGAPNSKKLYVSSDGATWSEIPSPFGHALGSLILLQE